MPKDNSPKKKRKRLARHRRKLVTTGVIAGIAILVLIGYLIYVGIYMGPTYTALAQKQWSKSTSLKADRGDILDRNGNVLAESYTTYQVCANPGSISTQDDRERIASILSAVLNIDRETVLAKLSKRSKSTGELLSQVKIKDQVEASAVQQLSSYQLESGGEISTYTDVKRNYPEGELFAQLLGFTDIDGNGQTGIEMTYNKYISGTDGKRVVETDRRGNAIEGGEEEYVAAVAGGTASLTVDTPVQQYLETALKQAIADTNAQSAFGVLLDPQTGEIYAVGTAPTFDPNNPPRSDALALLDLSRQRAATDTFIPGTLFEGITLAAGLDSGAISAGTRFNCTKNMKIDGETVRCLYNTYHKSESLSEAVKQSCSEAFMSMALSMGKDTFYKYLYAFGFGESTKSGLTGETSGTITHKKYIRDPELAEMSLGSGITVTGMEMAVAYAACINGGKLLKPYVISNITASSGEVVLENTYTVSGEPITAETSDRLRSLFTTVVTDGNGKSAAVPGYSVGGYPGMGFKLDDDGNVSNTRMVCSFVGFAPANKPQYLCLIIINEPEVPVSYGITLTAPYVQYVLSETLTYYGVKEDLNANNRATVPNVLGMTVADAAAALKQEGLSAKYIEGEGAASVQRQYPPAGQVVATDSTVTLYTAWTTFQGEETEIEYVKMPKVIGKNRIDALDALTKAGLVMDYDRSLSYGTVSAAEYEEGYSLPKGSTVRVEFTYTEE